MHISMHDLITSNTDKFWGLCSEDGRCKTKRPRLCWAEQIWDLILDDEGERNFNILPIIDYNLQLGRWIIALPFEMFRYTIWFSTEIFFLLTLKGLILSSAIHHMLGIIQYLCHLQPAQKLKLQQSVHIFAHYA